MSFLATITIIVMTPALLILGCALLVAVVAGVKAVFK